METMDQKINYLLHLADNALILGQRLGEWCGHGPVLEQDLAMTNISLDYIGRARLLYQYAAELKDGGSTEDTLAFLRNEWEYRNVLLVEQNNGDFAQTIVRQFFLEAFQFPYFRELKKSSDRRLAEIAEKSIKETAYHLRWSSEWVIRLGDGTETSREKIKAAVDSFWPFTGELFEESEYEMQMRSIDVAPELQLIQNYWMDKVQTIFKEAYLEIPATGWYQSGGKKGRHTEAMGFLLTDLQYMQRAYPGMEW